MGQQQRPRRHAAERVEQRLRARTRGPGSTSTSPTCEQQIDALAPEVADVDLAMRAVIRRRSRRDPDNQHIEPRCRAPPARARPPVDDAHLRRPLDRQEVQRALPREPREGPDRPLDRLRPADADRLRPRPRARARRGRQGRRPGRPQGRHARAARRHPARRDEHVDDDQRDGRLAAGALHRHRRGERASTPARSRARRRTTSSRSSWRAAPTRSRPGPRCG